MKDLIKFPNETVWLALTYTVYYVLRHLLGASREHGYLHATRRSREVSAVGQQIPMKAVTHSWWVSSSQPNQKIYKTKWVVAFYTKTSWSSSSEGLRRLNFTVRIYFNSLFYSYILILFVFITLHFILIVHASNFYKQVTKTEVIKSFILGSRERPFSLLPYFYRQI